MTTAIYDDDDGHDEPLTDGGNDTTTTTTIVDDGDGKRSTLWHDEPLTPADWRVINRTGIFLWGAWMFFSLIVVLASMFARSQDGAASSS